MTLARETSLDQTGRPSLTLTRLTLNRLTLLLAVGVELATEWADLGESC